MWHAGVFCREAITLFEGFLASEPLFMLQPPMENDILKAFRQVEDMSDSTSTPLKLSPTFIV